MNKQENLRTLFEDNKFFCALPWVHLYGSVDGIWGRCCMDNTVYYDHEYKQQSASEILLDKNSVGCVESSALAVGNKEKVKKLGEAFNAPGLCKTRRLMLEDKPVTACSQCYAVEEKDGESYRKKMNKLFRFWEAVNWNDLLENTDSEGRLDATPVYIDIRFGNHCNLKCIMCNFPTSSKWGDDTREDAKIIDPYSDNDRFWLDLEQMSENVSRIYFAGGEPFLQKGHLRLLNLLIEKEIAGRISLVYSTNLTVFPEKIMDKLKRFKLVELGVSCDGVESIFETIRVGAKWKQFYKNLLAAREHFPVTLLFTTQLANVFNLVDFFEWAIGEGFAIDLSNMLRHPESLSISNLDEASKKRLLVQFQDYRRKIIDRSAGEYAKQLDFVINFLTSDLKND